MRPLSLPRVEHDHRDDRLRRRSRSRRGSSAPGFLKREVGCPVLGDQLASGCRPAGAGRKRVEGVEGLAEDRAACFFLSCSRNLIELIPGISLSSELRVEEDHPIADAEEELPSVRLRGGRQGDRELRGGRVVLAGQAVLPEPPTTSRPPRQSGTGQRIVPARAQGRPAPAASRASSREQGIPTPGYAGRRGRYSARPPGLKRGGRPPRPLRRLSRQLDRLLVRFPPIDEWPQVGVPARSSITPSEVIRREVGIGHHPLREHGEEALGGVFVVRDDRCGCDLGLVERHRDVGDAPGPGTRHRPTRSRPEQARSVSGPETDPSPGRPGRSSIQSPVHASEIARRIAGMIGSHPAGTIWDSNHVNSGIERRIRRSTATSPAVIDRRRTMPQKLVRRHTPAPPPMRARGPRESGT